MRIQSLHRWDLSVPEARKVQQELARRVREEPLSKNIKYVAGTDVSYDRPRDLFVAGVVVIKFPEMETVEMQVHHGRTPFPYVPGYLSFREIPSLAGALEKVRSPVDLLIVDGQGRAHPRRIGLACHLGVLLDIPAIGAAKSRLCGEHREPAVRRGSSVALKEKGETIGRVVRTRAEVKPIYISVGHRVTLGEAERWVLKLSRTRIPEPTRRADRFVAAERRRIAGL